MNVPVSLARAEKIGVDALRALRPGAGEVAAVFRRSIYIRRGIAWACVGAPSIGAGPLNILVDLRCDWDTVFALGQPVRTEGERLRIGAVSLDLAGAAIWNPPACPGWKPRRATEGLTYLDELMGVYPPPENGLGCFVSDTGVPVSLEARATARLLTELSQWIAGYGRASADAVPLLGLGPGLTPSGDDYLAGFMATLHAVGHFYLRDCLWGSLESALPRATSAISGAHLECAARGRLAERQHLILNAILDGNRDGVRAGLAQLANDAHTSSWDGLAGISSAVRAVLSRADPSFGGGSCNEPVQLHTTC